MGSFLFLWGCTHPNGVSPQGTRSASHYCYIFVINSISHNMFFLPGNLEKEKNKSRNCEKLSTKSRSKIFDDHFPCNGSIFHDMYTFSAFCYHVYLIPHSVFFCIKLLEYSNSLVNFVIYIIRFPSYRKAFFSLCRFSAL